jgi:hypothetical protein
MAKCRDCGGEIIFRTEDGTRHPIHLSGYCSPGGSYATKTSFVIPNARCPVCRDRVFFYRSPFDGRVFFDELGPPWPKHPCTDNATEHFPLPPSPTRASETSRLKAEWQRSGWKPFRCRKAHYKEDTGMTRVVGDMEGEQGSERTLFVRGDVRTLRDYPALAKPKAETKGLYRIATFRLEGKKGEVEELYFDAYLLERRPPSTVAPRRGSRRKRRK